jgi:chromosome segregation ATPase
MSEAALVAIIIAILTAPVASVLTWFLNRKKDTASVINSITEAGQNAVETMNSALDTVKEQLSEVQAENAQLHSDICELKEQNKQLIKENEALRIDLRALKKQNEQLMEQIHDMRVAYEQRNENPPQ